MVRLLVVFALLSLVSAPAAAGWRAYETRHFTIYSESDPDRVAELASRVESYDKLMRLATGIREDNPVKVRIFEVANTAAIEKALGESNTGIAGFYDNNSLGPFLVTPRSTSNTGRYFTPELVLQHEYAHHFMLQYFPAVYPGWYVEGFAELIGSSMPMPDGRIGYGMPAKHRGKDVLGYWVPLQELLTREKVTYLDTYAQGWAVTHFLTFDTVRSKQLRSYLAALGEGKSSAEAAKAFGDLVRLNSDARRYVGAGSFAYKPVAVEITRPVITATRNLSAAEAALIPQIIAYRDDDLSTIRKAGDRERERRLREANLRRTREIAARFPTDPFGLHFLAVAERSLGDHNAALTAANRLLAIQPNHGGALVQRSLALSESVAKLPSPARVAMVKEARSLAVKANKANPEDPFALVAYYQSFNLAGVKPTSTAVSGLVKAVQLSPRDNVTRQLLVDRFEADRNWAAAIAALQPLANSAHDSPRRSIAREQMNRLQTELAKSTSTAGKS